MVHVYKGRISDTGHSQCALRFPLSEAWECRDADMVLAQEDRFFEEDADVEGQLEKQEAARTARGLAMRAIEHDTKTGASSFKWTRFSFLRYYCARFGWRDCLRSAAKDDEEPEKMRARKQC
jgi:hypothetical protein